MGIYRPENNSGGGDDSRFYGHLKANLVGVVNDPSKLDWADINLAFEFAVDGSDYTKILYITGAFDKDADGHIASNFYLNKMYALFDAIGFKGGLTKTGEWVDENDAPIDDIGAYLSAKFAVGADTETYKFIVFAYKRPNKAGAKYDFSTALLQRIWSNSDKGMKDSKSYVAYMRKNKYLKEYDETSSANHEAAQDVIAENGSVPNL